jgi:hypothetical protein
MGVRRAKNNFDIVSGTSQKKDSAYSELNFCLSHLILYQKSESLFFFLLYMYKYIERNGKKQSHATFSLKGGMGVCIFGANVFFKIFVLKQTILTVGFATKECLHFYC